MARAATYQPNLGPPLRQALRVGVALVLALAALWVVAGCGGAPKVTLPSGLGSGTVSGVPDFRWAYVIGWVCIALAIASIALNSFIQTTPKLTASLVVAGLGAFVLGYFLAKLFWLVCLVAGVAGLLFVVHILYVSVNWKDSEWGCVVRWLQNRRARTTMPREPAL